MKLQADAIQGLAVTGYGPDWVTVNGEKFNSHVVVSSMGDLFPWACDSFETLLPSHFEQLAALQPELILFGSGATIRFPNPQLLDALYARRIGVETMDTQAACRTYNFLAGEGRRVVAALLL
jgi:uncharacterized protein